LLRVVGRENDVLPDPQARLPGRGAYVHPSQTCFEQAQRRRAFARALRLPGAAGTAVLGQYLAQLHEESHQNRPGQPGRPEVGITAGKAGTDCDERPMRTRR
jgi:predicted RNA-binding protein YlxR (DUF448 family)